MLCKKCKQEKAIWHGYCLICFFAMPMGLPITPISSLRSGLSVSDCGDDISKKYKIKIEYEEGRGDD